MTSPPTRRFHHKFRDAIRGIRSGMAGQSSFSIHGLAAIVVILAGWWLRVTIVEWSILVLCIAIVWVAELFNSALESLAKGVTDQHDTQVGKALDVAGAAVLIAALGAAVVGLILLGYRLGIYFGWWPMPSP